MLWETRIQRIPGSSLFVQYGILNMGSDLNMAFYEHYVYQGSWHSFSRQRLQLLGGVSGNLFP